MRRIKLVSAVALLGLSALLMVSCAGSGSSRAEEDADTANSSVEQSQESVNLKVGDEAPNFDMVESDGKVVTLHDMLKEGKRILLYFYPADGTPGCTAEACSLRDGFDDLADNNVKVIGVSGDSEESHEKFKNEHKLPFELLADTTHAVAKSYGVWGAVFNGKKYTMRRSFLIGTDGKILAIFTDIDTQKHAQQVLDALGQ